jgi:hypothetical protein
MSEVKQTADEQIFSIVQSVAEGLVDGEVAAASLCLAVTYCHVREAALEDLRAMIGRAEVRLAYGVAGRPARQYPPSFGPARTASASPKYDSYGIPINPCSDQSSPADAR